MPRLDSRPMRWSGVMLLALLLVLLAGCTPEHPQSTFDTSGPVARSQLVLFYWIFWASVFVFVTVGGALLYTVIRYRKRPGDGDPEQIHGHRNLEIAWTVLPGLVLAVVAVPTVLTIFHNANSPDPGALTVDVIASQWWWEFQYPHPTEAGDKLVTANELHMPVGETVNVTLDSKDVLHSFWIPKIAGKVDVVPNNNNTMWIWADEPGVYLGQCAEFCGVAHALMRFQVIAEPRAEFEAWLVAQAQPAAEPIEPLAKEGKELFEGKQAQCWSCHTIEGSKRSRGQLGPNLTHLASRSHIAAGIMENTQENLRKWLQDPCDVKPGNNMCTDAKVFNDPERKLSEAQISALVAYLSGLK